MNTLWLSGYVNLLGAGVSTAASKAQVLTWVPTDQQSAVGTLIDSLQAACVTLGQAAWTLRAPSWGYIIDSPFQTYLDN